MSRYPMAPALSIRNAILPSLWLLIAMICVSGHCFLMISVASIPFISGILISIRITSTASVAKKSKASFALLNEPHSTIVEVFFKINSNPLRTSG
ncbi:hypothetical protein D3C71_1796050 [compost metagenome]